MIGKPGKDISREHAFEHIFGFMIFNDTRVGNGCGLEHRSFLSPGDVIELEVSGLGVLRNQVVQP